MNETISNIYKKITTTPLFDINEYFFADEHTLNCALTQYAKNIRNFWLKRIIPCFLVILIVICCIVGIWSFNSGYNNGFIDNQAYSPDNSPIVVITPNGKKYHKRTCDYVTTAIEISKTKANDKGYTSCSVCNP